MIHQQNRYCTQKLRRLNLQQLDLHSTIGPSNCSVKLRPVRQCPIHSAVVIVYTKLRRICPGCGIYQRGGGIVYCRRYGTQPLTSPTSPRGIQASGVPDVPGVPFAAGSFSVLLKKNLNISKPSEHPPSV